MHEPRIRIPSLLPRRGVACHAGRRCADLPRVPLARRPRGRFRRRASGTRDCRREARQPGTYRRCEAALLALSVVMWTIGTYQWLGMSGSALLLRRAVLAVRVVPATPRVEASDA